MMFCLARIRKRGGFILLESGSGEGKVATERSGKVAKTMRNKQADRRQWSTKREQQRYQHLIVDETVCRER